MESLEALPARICLCLFIPASGAQRQAAQTGSVPLVPAGALVAVLVSRRHELGLCMSLKCLVSFKGVVGDWIG